MPVGMSADNGASLPGETEEEIFRNGGQHAMKEHGMKEEDLTSEFKEKLRGLIRDN